MLRCTKTESRESSVVLSSSGMSISQRYLRLGQLLKALTSMIELKELTSFIELVERLR